MRQRTGIPIPRRLTSYPSLRGLQARSNPALAECAASGLLRYARNDVRCLPRLILQNVAIIRFRQKDHADEETDARDDDGIPDPVIHIAGRRDDREGDRRHETTEPAVAEVIRTRQRRITETR